MKQREEKKNYSQRTTKKDEEKGKGLEIHSGEKQESDALEIKQDRNVWGVRGMVIDEAEGLRRAFWP